VNYRIRKYLRYTKSALLFAKNGNLPYFFLGIRVIFCVMISDILCNFIKNIECTFCNYRGYKFDPFFSYPNRDYRIEARCPSCGCLERHRLLSLFLNRLTDNISGYDVLDIAPNNGFQKYFTDTNYITTDLYVKNVDVRCNLENNIPFKNESFDFIMCYHVLEHINNDTCAMQEIFRILRHRRVAIIQVPMDEKSYKTIEYQYPNIAEHGHVRRYGADFFCKLKHAGFEVSIDKIDSITANDRIKYGIKDEFIILAKKE
jgi:SAM-dependent methyltransferase